MRKLQQARSLAALLLWAIFQPATLAQTASSTDPTVDPILPLSQTTESIQGPITLSQYFSTTTKLPGIVITAANAGGFEGDPCGICKAARIIDINGNEITRSQPNATVLYRASLFLDTSFNGTDLLRILIEVDRNSYANISAQGFSTLAFVNNYSNCSTGRLTRREEILELET